ncbi:hypothetical protein MSBR2_2753 [Methanosarcina barkeri 227]|uniref:Uncharacterized protein n=2 Tax=Methanosarcina barkeri TaxID=2208 RepID=A0A0E3QYA5_METBA|nr:hypothetical protein MSBRM_2796 [Methanosarcina barkeri MS]AKB59269.1 hypothetical protein MSBR2_2753 [Methanosarcina barkeri 227]
MLIPFIDIFRDKSIVCSSLRFAHLYEDRDKRYLLIIEYFATLMANISSCFLSTTYVSSISSNIALVSKTIELAVFVRTSNVKELWFWTSFSHKHMMLKYIIPIGYKLTIYKSRTR